MENDQKLFSERILKNDKGEILNPIQINGLPENADAKAVGKKLNELSDNARTHGFYDEIGSLYGFKLLVKTEASMKDGFDFTENRFFAEGSNGIKYTYNNGIIASDPKLASMNFLNAMQKIPTLIDNEHKRIAKEQASLPVLQEVVSAVWKKEELLKELKKELGAVDRKILEGIMGKGNSESKSLEKETKLSTEAVAEGQSAYSGRMKM